MLLSLPLYTATCKCTMNLRSVVLVYTNQDDLTVLESSFCNFPQDNNYTGNCDDDGLLDLLFGQDFPDFGNVSPPRSESTSSDSDMTPSPNAMDDVELSEILSSTSSPGLPQNSEDFTIDLGKWIFFQNSLH